MPDNPKKTALVHNQGSPKKQPEKIHQLQSPPKKSPQRIGSVKPQKGK